MFMKVFLVEQGESKEVKLDVVVVVVAAAAAAGDDDGNDKGGIGGGEGRKGKGKSFCE
jgi:hypothetical protein